MSQKLFTTTIETKQKLINNAGVVLGESSTKNFRTLVYKYTKFIYLNRKRAVSNQNQTKCQQIFCLKEKKKKGQSADMCR